MHIIMYACLYIGIFPSLYAVALYKSSKGFGKDCLWQLLATVENITNVKSYLVLFTNWSYTPA